MDTVSVQKRSENMSKIRGKDTRPERVVRSLVHGLGFRFRLHRRDLPGTPDLTLPRLGKVIFVHGCFWHQHLGCKYAYSPKSNQAFWSQKFANNSERDQMAVKALRYAGWGVMTIWECEIGHLEKLTRRIERFLAR